MLFKLYARMAAFSSNPQVAFRRRVFNTHTGHLTVHNNVMQVATDALKYLCCNDMGNRLAALILLCSPFATLQIAHFHLGLLLYCYLRLPNAAFFVSFPLPFSCASSAFRLSPVLDVVDPAGAKKL